MGSGQIVLTWTDEKAATKAWILNDTIRNDGMTDTVNTSDYVVEEGLPVTDHARPAPRTIALDVYISSFPLRVDGMTTKVLSVPPAPAPTRAFSTNALIDKVIAAAKGTPGTQISNVNAIVPPQGRDFVKEATAYLDELSGQITGRPRIVEVTSTLETYPGLYILTTATRTRAAEDGTGMSVSLEFKRVRFATVRTVPTPKTTALSTTKRVAKGKADPVPTKPGQKDSLAFSAAGEQVKKFLGGI